MRLTNKYLLSILLFLIFSLLYSEVQRKDPANEIRVGKGPTKQELSKKNLSRVEEASLKALAGIMHLFKNSSREIWPGYDLSKKEFVYYVPEKWALLLNSKREVKEFNHYPQGWPDIGCSAQYHSGKYDNLIGQLAFNFPVNSFITVAVGMPEEMILAMPNPEVYLFGFMAHEVFHQFQYDSFGDIPWEREEKYPILDIENTAFASLEMKLLVDAVKAAYSNKREETKDCLKQFTAVRRHRWRIADPFVPKYEQGMEINEGTAQYVQTKCVTLFKKMKLIQTDDELLLSLKKDFSDISMPDYLLDDFRKRVTEGTISPDDMPRNRIYPVGSTLGFLADYFQMEWKQKAQIKPSEFSFEALFSEHLGLVDEQIPVLLDKAKAKYEYKKILASAKKLIDEYHGGYKKDLRDFKSQAGYRLEIAFAYDSISRSRLSMAKKWLVDSGKISLCKHYKVYTLKNKDLQLSLKKTGLYEENEWDEQKKRVVFYADDISSLLLDGKSLEFKDSIERSFKEIKIEGNNFSFHCKRAGKITISKKDLMIELN